MRTPLQPHTTCPQCHETGCETPYPCPDPCPVPVDRICSYATERTIQPQTSYAVAMKKVNQTLGCPGNTACGGVTAPLKEFVQNFIFEKYSPYLCVNQVDHGFVFDGTPIPVYQDQANNGVWLLAQSGVNAAEAVICGVSDENNFEVLAAPGFLKGAHLLDPGEIYYLSGTVPGGVTTDVTEQRLFNALNPVIIQYDPGCSAPVPVDAPVAVDDFIGLGEVFANIPNPMTVTNNDSPGSLPVIGLALIDPVTDLEAQLVNFTEGVFAVDDPDTISFTSPFSFSDSPVTPIEYVLIDSAGTRSNRATLNVDTDLT